MLRRYSVVLNLSVLLLLINLASPAALAAAGPSAESPTSEPASASAAPTENLAGEAVAEDTPSAEASPSGGAAGDPQETFFQPALEAGRVAKFTGAASYGIPLEMPSGASGLSIPLSLQYSSDLAAAKTGAGNSDGGWLGIGWGLDVGRVELSGGISGDHRLVVGGVSQDLKLRESESQSCADRDGWTCEGQLLQRFTPAAGSPRGSSRASAAAPAFRRPSSSTATAWARSA